MCRQCADLLEAAALELADQVMLAEDTGYAGARRRLTAAEKRAAVRFGDLDALYRAAAAAASAALAPVFTAAADAVLDALGDGNVVQARQAAAAVERLSREQPPAVADAAAAASAALAAIMEDTYRRSRTMAAAEAEAQGVTGARLQAAHPPENVPGLPVLQAVAAGVALTPWARTLQVAQRDLTGAVAAAGVDRERAEAALRGISRDGALDEARQGLHQAIGAGRGDAAAAAEPTRIYASELLDGNTCPACADVDGREYDSLEAAREDYPLGGFARCDGGPRCRGTLVYEYRPGRDGAMPDPPRSILDELDV